MFRTRAGPVPVNQVPVVFGSGRPFFATGAPVELLLLENPMIVPGDRVSFASPASQNSSSAAATASGIRCTIARRAEGWNRISYGCVGSVVTRRWRAAGMQAESSGEARSRGNACRSGEMV
jgi:hypothetical protein